MAVSTRLSSRQGRKFAFTLGIALAVVGLLSLWRGHVIAPYVFLVPGVLLLAAGVVIPTHLGPVERAWMNLGHRMSVVMTPVMMAVVYFGALTPFGLLMRAFGKHPLTEHHGAASTWVPREKKRQSDLTRQF